LNSDWTKDPTYASIEKDEIQKRDKVTSKTFLVVMIDGSEYHVPLAFDDEPLSPVRRKLELFKLKTEMERRQRESPSTRQSRVERWKKSHDESGELLLDFPSAMTFELLGEEMKNGHAAYVLSATPKKGIVPTTRAAKVLSGVQGKVWVEKETMHPIHVECTVVKPVPVYGPLATVLPGTDIEINMTKVADSIWLIDAVSMKLNVSKLHVLKSTEFTRSTYTKYRPNEATVEELAAEANRE
jgi:hypothetical protein